MPTLCTKCNINWAQPASQDGDDDEQYEFCPVCSTDMFLQESEDPNTFMYSTITGRIINVHTQQELIREQPAVPNTARKIIGKIDWESDQVKSDRQMKAIDAYHAALAAGGDGERAYFDTLNTK